jgi:beta-N-acetylhexosaminidase
MHEFTGGEFLVMGIPAEKLDKETTEIIKRVQPAGFILFARNIKSPEQLRNLTDELRASVNHDPIITIDQEGGRVSRLKEFMTEPPSAKKLTEHGDVSLIKKHGELTGKLLRLFGFNLNLAPVLDTLVNEKNENSLKDRTYGTSTKQVVENGTAFAKAMSAEGILCCGKHFPGYSHANVDPHHGLPTVDRSYDELVSLEWAPFKQLLPILDCLMVGHVSYPKVDPSNLPASLSRLVVHKTLREDWKFTGCTVTDDMDMGAIKEKYGSAESARQALEAGNDLMLVCHSIQVVPEIAAALRKVDTAVLNESFGRITNMRNRLAAPTPFSMDAFKALDAETKEMRDKVFAAETAAAVR